MIVIFVHGWSVRNTDTYGDLPKWLANQTTPSGEKFDVGNVYLGKYISFHDEVTLDDVARAFEQALHDAIGSRLAGGERFACITHSTGGPVVRLWMDLYWKQELKKCPLSHLVMLAPANHGSALAQLGKSRLSRIKTFFQGVEPGERILNWLELGSDPQWELNASWLNYDCVANSVFPFVLIGQQIDSNLYDHLNSYTGEKGSDGVVRVAAANVNYSKLLLRQVGEELKVANYTSTKPTAFGVLPGRSHSGEKMGIIRSVKLSKADTHPTAQWVLRCLGVEDSQGYDKVAQDLEQLTQTTQAKDAAAKQLFSPSGPSRYSMVVFRLRDDRQHDLSDYDLYLTAGPMYSRDSLPKGFFVDRQRNLKNPGKLTYFLDFDVMEKGLDTEELEGKLGFTLVARPVEGKALAFYNEVKFESKVHTVNVLLKPNQTLMVEIELLRRVDATVCRLENDITPSKISDKPSGKIVD